MSELGPLYGPMSQTDYFWVVLVIFAVPASAVCCYALFKGHAPGFVGGMSIWLVPIIGYLLGNVHVLDESKRVEFCASCHVTMPPLVESMEMDGDDLAALHYQTGAVSRNDACYQCHSGYGLGGDFQAKLAGLNHMVHTVLDTQRFPLRMRKPFDIKSCLDCHAQTPAFQEVKGHRTMGIQNKLMSGEIGCSSSCHAPSHPSAALYGTRAWERWKESQQ